jgi:hypothetical protein
LDPDEAGFREFVARHSSWVLVGLGSSLEVFFLWLALTGQASSWPALSVGYFMTFAIFLLSIYVMGGAGPSRSAGRDFVIILVFAAAFRFTLTLSQPNLSWDVFRYYWDGKVMSNGINPYMYPPGAPQLQPLIDNFWTMVNHKDLWTPYPPFSQLVFTITYSIWQSPSAFRILFDLFDVLVIVTIYMVLKSLKQKTANVLVYAWCPLLVVEVGQSSHNDPMTVFLVVLSFLLVLMKRTTLSSLALALGSLSKYYPIVLAPLFFRRWRVKGIALYFSVLILSYLPFLGAGWRILNGMSYVANAYVFNSSIFPSLQWLMQTLGATNPGQLAQYATYTVFLLVFLLVIRLALLHDASNDDLWKYSFILTGALVILNRALFPWYLIWAVPYLCVHRSKAWILLTGTVMLGYFRYNVFPPPDFESVSPAVSLLISLLVYLPFFAVLAYELWKERRVVRSFLGLPLGQGGRTPSADLAVGRGGGKVALVRSHIVRWIGGVSDRMDAPDTGLNDGRRGA